MPETRIDTNSICFTLSDLGNAELFSAHNEGKVAYVPELNVWRYYDGKVWRDDPQLVHMRFLATIAVRKLYGQAEMYDSTEERTRVAQHALKSEGIDRINAMIKLAQSEPGMAIHLSDWDIDRYSLNVANGTLDLRTGELKPHSRKDLITRIIDLPYDTNNNCPLWLEFLNKVTARDAELEIYLQQAVGYSLTGDISRQVFFFLYGLGSNGKSTFTQAIRQLLGPYATRISADTIMTYLRGGGNGSHSEGLANIRGKRFILASESDEGGQLAVSLIKNLTGGESIRASRKYEHEVEFFPECKLWLFGNHKPIIKDTTLSIWRRVKMIPFNVTISDEEKDEMLPVKLESEYAGILDWAVKGCMAWLQERLPDIHTVTEATLSYRHDSDLLADFLDDCCEFNDVYRVEKSVLKDSYNQWCERNGQEPLNRLNFKQRLMEKGVSEYRGHGGIRYWQGIRIVTQKSPGDNSENANLASKNDNGDNT